ncbi:variable surface lipoprotein [Mycoplasmopsis bovis]|uniref:variable surface lipoprotein n=1 Tax=Mycoplasmopsis bovis TaxID=28903 RepID=UPI003D0528FF
MIIISLSSIISISSMPLIAASCENKNPTDESIINNIAPQTQGNLNQEDNSKEKEQKDDPSGSDSSSPNTTPQIQDNQNHQEDNIKEKEQSDDPRDLLEQLEKIRKDYEKTEKENENLIKNSNYSDVLNNWFGDIYRGRLGHKWNYYLQFKNIVEKRQKPESWFKAVKEFIKKYETEIKKYLEENLSIEK